MTDSSSMASRPVVLITGSATGVGRATALLFASEGYDVVVNHPPGQDEAEAGDTAAVVEKHGVNALIVACDVSSDEQVRGMATTVEQTFGRLDVLVNCAGTTYFVKHADLDGMTEEMWDRILAVNTKGPFFVTRAMTPLLKQSAKSDKPTTIVNVSSVAGVSGEGSSLAYCASKGALNTMTKSLARALAPDIRVNAVCPGPIDSRWLRRGMTDEELADYVEGFPLPYLSQPEDIAEGIFYLATKSKTVTGHLLIIDGGRRM